MTTCSLPPIVFMGVLLVSRLEASVFSTFIILIPVFGILGCCMCGVLCGICAFSCLDTGSLAGEENKESVPTHSDDIESNLNETLQAELSNLSQRDQNNNTNTTQFPVYVIPEPSSFNQPTNTSNVDVGTNQGTVDVTHIDADID